MYPEVLGWAERWVREQVGARKPEGYDTHGFQLNDLIKRERLENFFGSREWETFDIKVDIVVFYRASSRSGMVFVECKVGPISVGDLSQLLGYCKIAKPTHAFLVSPGGIGTTVSRLISVYKRLDILEYTCEPGVVPRRIVLGRWDGGTAALDAGSVLPDGALG